MEPNISASTTLTLKKKMKNLLMRFKKIFDGWDLTGVSIFTLLQTTSKISINMPSHSSKKAKLTSAAFLRTKYENTEEH